jgi:hypothetical protein
MFVLFVALISIWVLNMEPYSGFGSLNKLCFPSVAEVTKLAYALRREEQSVVRLGMCYGNLNCITQTTNEGTQNTSMQIRVFITFQSQEVSLLPMRSRLKSNVLSIYVCTKY